MSKSVVHSRPSCSRIAPIAVVFFIAASLRAGPVVYVDDTAAIGGDGQSWTTAFRDLQDGLIYAAIPANGVTEVRVAQGLYKPDESEANPDGTGDRAATFQLINGVAIKGGYRGLPVLKGENPDDRDIRNFVSILSGDLNGDDGPEFANNGENSLHVVAGSGTDGTAVLDGVTIIAGNADNGLPLSVDDYGGGMIIIGGDPTVRECHFTNCKALWGGGAMAVKMAGPTISDCLLDQNRAFDGGACNIADYSDPLFERCVFNLNEAGSGGSMYVYFQCNITVHQCEFNSSTASWEGGAVLIHDDGDDLFLAEFHECSFTGNISPEIGGAVQLGSVKARGYVEAEFTDCDFISNSAGLIGGGIGFYDHALATLSHCRFTDNSAAYSGGAIGNYQLAGCWITDSQFDHNSAVELGGGIAWQLFYGHLDIEGCDFTNNSARTGGGLWTNVEDFVEITDSRFEHNTAIEQGGGMSMTGYGNPGLVPISNCQFIANSASEGGALHTWFRGAIRNCEFRANQAVTGGAVAAKTFQIFPWNCVFTGNVAQQRGGAMHSTEGAIAVLSSFAGNQAGQGGGAIDGQYTQLLNCVIWQNTPDGVAAPYDLVDYCDLQEPFDGGIGNISADPMFIDADGPDNIFGTEDDNLRLRGGSPCINTGDSSFYPPVDLDGNPRNVHGVDIGPYEYQNFCALDIVPNGAITIDDLVLVITNWGWAGTPGSNAADVNSSGTVDIDDLVEVITHWGACP